MVLSASAGSYSYPKNLLINDEMVLFQVTKYSRDPMDEFYLETRIS